MTENGPSAIYRTSPIYDFFPNIDLPTCMYKMSHLINEAENLQPSSQDDKKLLELEKNQMQLLKKLEDLKSQVLVLKNEMVSPKSEKLEKYQDIVIKASPNHPPFSIWVFYHLLSKSMNVRLVTFIHSSLITIPEVVTLKALKGITGPEPWDLSLTVIWRDVNDDNEMMLDPLQQGVIKGEVNIARYLARLLGIYDVDPVASTLADNWLELAHSSVIHGSNKEKQAAVKSLNSHLGKNKFLVEDTETLADIVIWSALVQSKLHLNLPPNAQRWFNLLLNSSYFEKCDDLIMI